MFINALKRSRSTSDLKHAKSCVDSIPIDMSLLPPSVLFFPDKPVEEYNPALWEELAIMALNHYHATQGIKLEISGKVIVEHYIYGRLWGFHFSFDAISEDGDLKKVLAEVFRHKDLRTCVINFCTVIDPNDPDIVKGCCQCPKAVLHPKGVTFFKIPNPEDFTTNGC